ncbi:hypothetical protein [Nitrincola sp.]|uniref:hypothetical protein n=1 Tax=Nitrincola sp. TaxID=1926584 RepID=UPI003A952A40
MARHLTTDDVKAIVKMLHKWQYELTWDLLVDSCKTQLGILTTRQALDRKQEIKEVFALTKKRLKEVGSSNYARPNSIDVAHKRIESLAEQVKSLTKTNDFLIEKFIRWQYNAMSAGMTMEQLERPLKPSDLQRKEFRKT